MKTQITCNKRLFSLNQKAQAGVEYLMTYGWALVLIAAVVGVIVFLIGSLAQQVTFSSSDPTKILMKASAVTGTDAQIKMQNITGGGIKVTNASMPAGYSACNLNEEGTSLISPSNPVTVMAGGEILIECTNVSEVSGTISIEYTDYAGLQRNVRITASGTGGTILPAGLVAWYRFEEGSGSTTADSSGNGNNGTLVGPPTWQTSDCPSGNCLSFDGSGDYVNCGDIESAEATDKLTISFWIKPKVVQTVRGMFSKNEDSESWEVAYGSTSKVRWQLTTSSRVTFSSATAITDTSKWYHVVLTYNGSEMAGYIDGLPDGTPVAQTGNIANTTSDVWIGCAYSTSYSSNSFIDEVMIYNKVLSDTEICDLCEEHEVAAGITCSC